MKILYTIALIALAFTAAAQHKADTSRPFPATYWALDTAIQEPAAYIVFSGDDISYQDQVAHGRMTIKGDTMQLIRYIILQKDSLSRLNSKLRIAVADIIQATYGMKATDAQVKRWKAAIDAYWDILDGKEPKKKGGKK